jgi:hypothetical protein
VVTFAFTLFVRTAVPRPAGWLDLSWDDTLVMARNSVVAVPLYIRTPTGLPAEAEVHAVWTMADPSLAYGTANYLWSRGRTGQTVVVVRSDEYADTLLLRVGIPPLVAVIPSMTDHGWRPTTCALDQEGFAFCWGGFYESSVPVPRRQRGARYVALSGMTEEWCGITAAGAAFCWGHWTPGPSRLGEDTVQFSAISGGSTTGCALTATGRAYCWHRGAPLPVAQGALRFVQVGAAPERACGLADTGQAYCWSLITGVAGSFDPATAVPAGVDQAGRTYASLAVGPRVSCGITRARQVYCWGDNTRGQLGNGSTVSSSIPVPVQQGGLGYVEVSPGLLHTCAIATTGESFCWGANESGQLGDGTTSDSRVPVMVLQPLSSSFVHVWAGGDHTCAVTEAGDAYCWGGNHAGQLGNGGATASAVPVLVQR